VFSLDDARPAAEHLLYIGPIRLKPIHACAGRGQLNVGHYAASLTEALIFITIVDVDALTLWSMIGAAVLGSWLGAGAVILPGTRLGRNTVVGAGAVVRGDYPDHAVLAGVPAKVVRRYDPAAGWQPELRDLHIEPPDGWTVRSAGPH
jgi:hypothetical protein